MMTAKINRDAEIMFGTLITSLFPCAVDGLVFSFMIPAPSALPRVFGFLISVCACRMARLM